MRWSAGRRAMQMRLCARVPQLCSRMRLGWEGVWGAVAAGEADVVGEEAEVEQAFGVMTRGSLRPALESGSRCGWLRALAALRHGGRGRWVLLRH